MVKNYLPFILLAVFISSCGSKRKPAFGEVIPGEGLEYAVKFSVTEHEEYKILTVHAPWQNAGNTDFKYALASDLESIPDTLTSCLKVNTPLDNVVILSTTFIPFIDSLGKISTVKGISGGQYIFNPELRNKLERKELFDVGYDGSLNYERIVSLKPAAVFMFGVEAGITQIVDKLAEAGIPVILCADYLEPHPLGRAEWIKFFAAFYEEDRQAEQIFEKIKTSYEELVTEALHYNEKPSVFLGFPWKDTWFIAGGNSFAAQLIHDAGGTYIFHDLESREAVPVGLETVFERALDADIWLNPGVALSNKMILAHDERFENLKALKEMGVYSNARRLGPGGGNDYWESGTLRPDIILSDLIRIFHQPEPDSMYFYFRLR